ncbi:MAG: PA2779 family protein [Haliea sp.]
MLKSRLLIMLQIAAFLVASTAGTAQAAVIGNAEHFAQQHRSEQLAAIDAVLAREVVQQQMVAMGVSHADAMERIGALSDAELQQLALNLDTLPAGASALGVLGALFLVLLVLEILGVTNVFTKI